jgi:hypothetical protein
LHPHAVREACPELDGLAEHVSRFAVMVTGLRGDRLNDWLTAVETDDRPELCSFAMGIRCDYDAVPNGLALRHNSGPVEGHVNRIRMIKRQMYGRANLDLLRKGVLFTWRHHHGIWARSIFTRRRHKADSIVVDGGVASAFSGDAQLSTRRLAGRDGCAPHPEWRAKWVPIEGFFRCWPRR